MGGDHQRGSEAQPGWGFFFLAPGRQLAPEEVVDLINLVSQYVLFALVNNVFQVPLEAPLRDAPGLAQT